MPQDSCRCRPGDRDRDRAVRALSDTRPTLEGGFRSSRSAAHLWRARDRLHTVMKASSRQRRHASTWSAPLCAAGCQGSPCGSGATPRQRAPRDSKNARRRTSQPRARVSAEGRSDEIVAQSATTASLEDRTVRGRSTLRSSLGCVASASVGLWPVDDQARAGVVGPEHLPVEMDEREGLVRAHVVVDGGGE